MRNRKLNWFVLGLLGLLAVGAGAYFWANAIIASLMDYHSPLTASAPAPGEPVGQPITRQVVIVLLDALREDTALDPNIMPFLESLRLQGASATMLSRPPSFSAPGWATLLTGAWPDINDSQVLNPPDKINVWTFTQDDIFAAVNRVGLNTAVSGYSWFEQMLANSGLDAGFYTPGEDAAADREVVDAALPWLGADYQLVLIHIDQIDYAGHHQGGPRSPNWAAAASRADGLLNEIASRLDLQQDTLIVLSDHGQIDPGGHGGTEKVTTTEPFVAVGAGIIPGRYTQIHMVDVAPTVAVLLGTNLPASGQGRPLWELLDIPAERLTAIQTQLATQQDILLKAYTSAIGEAVPATTGSSPTVASTQLLIEKARMARLARERVWRNVFAVFAVVLPAYLLILRREKKALWLLAGAAVYLLIFNLRYAVLGGHTYSLSSVPEQMIFILYTAGNTAIALVPAWLTAMFGLRAFRAGPRQATALALGFLWFLLYILAIPAALNFAINGPTTTWTLPEFVTQFQGFFAIVQGLFVAGLGLVLLGIGALVARFDKH
jgi:hypothetical protein